MKKSRILMVMGVALLFMVNTAHATILHVPGDYPTIQTALVYAGSGDTILVAPGTYYEHIVWPSTPGIHLVSEYGADSTVIDAIGSLRAITMETDVDSTTVIKGFTIVNGNEDYGGGIYCALASPTITNNTIMNNSASFGGGIFCNEGAPIITQNLITGNVTSGEGGGICSYFSSPKIVGNIIENNASSYYGGGGICFAVSWPLITGNTVSSNSAYLGGGMYFYKSTSVITYNTISNNDAEYGDGLYFSESDGNVNYNEIFGNGCGMHKGDPDMINAEHNWWGDVTGPYHLTLNPSGLGDTVSDYIDFDPWLTGPSVEEQPIVKHIDGQSILGATIFRGPLQLPEGKKCKVFDITGRMVEPDRIQPGIYFIEVDGVVTQKVVKVR